MTCTHTPGPWHTAHHADDTVEGLHVVHDVTGLPVARMGGFTTRRNCEANARLIAAAPDLLAALTELEQLVTAHIPDECDNWCRAARAALAAAGVQL